MNNSNNNGNTKKSNVIYLSKRKQAKREIKMMVDADIVDKIVDTKEWLKSDYNEYFSVTDIFE